MKNISDTWSCTEYPDLLYSLFPEAENKANTVLLCAQCQSEGGCVSCLKLVFKEVSCTSDYWFPNARVQLIKKYM